MRSDGLIRATLRLMSEMVALPRIMRPQARYVEWRGSARISWCSLLNTSVKIWGAGRGWRGRGAGGGRVLQAVGAQLSKAQGEGGMRVWQPWYSTKKCGCWPKIWGAGGQGVGGGFRV